jgi:hypothetical protein
MEFVFHFISLKFELFVRFFNGSFFLESFYEGFGASTTRFILALMVLLIVLELFTVSF